MNLREEVIIDDYPFAGLGELVMVVLLIAGFFGSVIGGAFLFCSGVRFLMDSVGTYVR